MNEKLIETFKASIKINVKMLEAVRQYDFNHIADPSEALLNEAWAFFASMAADGTIKPSKYDPFETMIEIINRVCREVKQNDFSSFNL